ncbi:PAS domain-containing protein [Pseudoduganella namucuonensis]|uniref:Sensory/regulatory protein RpfC n=1 Tax=Pseudoduganella namucuonensis TaxID=1035707 RepID=A0A1I7JHQ8_9BURK|nr:PAS domain-containing protein [Pseudoduganella namucuonensis]SFU84739.1 PAS domain S-box-containing protein [Pseudoduganella namucuonensis]
MFKPSGKLPSIRSQIALLVLVCALPSIIGLGVMVQHFYQRETLQVSRDTLETARALASAIEHDLREAQSAALALASSPSLAAGDFAAFTEQARRQLRPDFPAGQFLLSDAGGVHHAFTPGPGAPTAPPPPLLNAARLRPLFEHGEPVVSQIPADRDAPDRQPWLAIDVPVMRDGRVAYALSAVLRREQLGEMLAEQRLPEHVLASLADADGVLLARSRDAHKFVGRNMPEAVSRQLRDAEEGTLRAVTIDGVPVYAGFSRLPGRNLTVLVGIPEQNALDGMMPSVPLVSGAVTLLVLAGFGMSWMMGGHIGRSVRALTQPARALAAGTPIAPAPSNFLEAEEVAQALRQVEIEVQRHRHELELLVAERTAELEASKALLENVYASAPVGLSFVDPQLNIVMINEYLAAINAKPVSEHIGHSFGDVIRDDQVRLEVERDYRRVLATGEAISGIELTGTAPGRPDDIRHWLTGYFPVRAQDGAIIGITGLLLDITDQKRTEAELQRSKQLFKSVVENMPAMLFVKRAGDLRFEMLNHQGELTLGLPRSQLLGKNDHDLFPAEQADAFTAADRAVLASDRVIEIAEEPISTAGGEKRYLNTRKVALRDEHGNPTHLLGMAIDITERKRADEAMRATSLSLARNNAFIRTVTDNVPGTVVYWDAELRCRFANKYFSEFIRMPIGDIMGATMREVLGEELYRENLPYVDGVMAGKAQSFYQDRVGPGGDARYMWANYIPDLDEHRKARGFFVMVSDVTELKRSELRLHDLNDELVRARDRAEAASRAKSEFVANMSHEIRTPMNAILGLARLLEEAPLERRERSYVGKIQMATQSLLTVVNDVLDFSKIEAGQLKLDPGRFNLDHILSSVGVLISQAAWDKGVEPIFAVGADVPMELVGDAMRLQQVLLNLAGNAVKFTHQGEVALGVRQTGGNATHVTLEFSVRDTGIGIGADKQRRMFEAFSQEDNSTSRKYGGTGLGLAICRRLVDLMGGTISVHSEPGRGSIFRFAVTLERAVPGIPEPAPLPQALQGLSLLIVDDNATVRELLSRHCQSLGWTVWTADSGAAALAMLHKLARAVGPPKLDLLLLDARLPDLDGIALLTRAHTDDRLALPPTIMMAADHLTEEMLAIADTLHIATVLAKPATPVRLIAAIAAVRTGTAQPSALPASTPLTGRLAGVRLLLVEDNEINQEMAQYILLHAGARVEIAGNGRVAVNMLTADPQRCDVVLMDLQMPVMNGYEATAALRAMGLTALPIIAMTANALDEDRRLATDAGIDAHIPKPIDVEEMIATLTRFITVRGDGACEGPGRWPDELDDRPVSLPGIDLDAALARLAGNYPAFVGLLKRFENSQGDTVSEVRALLTNDKRQQAAQLLHRLRGVAANLGAGDIARLSAQAEIALHEANEPDLAFTLTALDQSITVVTEAARTLPLPLPAATAAPDKDAPDANLPQALEELVSLLQTNNMKALTHFQGLRAALEPDEREAVLALADAIETLDFAAAEKQVRDMLKRKEFA